MHLVDHIHNHCLDKDNVLHVVGVISNPVRYHSRYRLFRKWYERMLATPNVKVYVVEAAFGDRPFQVTDPCNPHHLQVRTHQELWLKENLINLGVRHLLPRNWKYVAWSDCDILFCDDHWAQEALHQLQHYHVIQPWMNCSDLGFQGEVLSLFDSFCSVHARGIRKQCHPGEPYKYAHSGYIWCCTREFWENVHGLMDWNCVGSGDHHMAWACINGVHHSVHRGMHQSFKDRALEWQRNAFRVTNGHLGYVKTRIEHMFHGSKKNRKYRERWSIFIDHQFDPNKDLRYDSQGLLQLVGKPALMDEIRQYNRARHEDSIDD